MKKRIFIIGYSANKGGVEASIKDLWIVMITLIYLGAKILPAIDNFIIWILYATVVSVATFATFIIVDSIFDRKALFNILNIIGYKSNSIKTINES